MDDNALFGSQSAIQKEQAALAAARGSAAFVELLNAIAEFRRHAMYPANVYGNHASGFVELCSDEKKMAFIHANERLDKAIAALPPNDQAHPRRQKSNEDQTTA